MNKLNEILSIIDSHIGGSQWFVFLLLGTGLFFTVYLKFPQFRYLKYALRIVRGKFDRAGDVGDTSHFQDRKSTRLNSSHVKISYAVFCLKKKNNEKISY